jgi:hypothetical protein
MKPTIGSLGYPNCIPTKILTLGAAVGMVAGSVASASAQFFGVRLPLRGAMVKRWGIDGDCNHET